MKKFLIFFSFVCAAFAPIFSHAAGIRAKAEKVKPEISVKIDEGQPRYLYKDKVIRCAHLGHADGCTRASIYAQIHSVELTPDGALKKLSLQIGLKDVEIELSSELEKGSCFFDVALKHELTHLALHRKIVKRFATEIAKAVLSVAETMPSPITQAQFNRIGSILNNYVNRMMEENGKQNALIDSDNAYLYQWKQCLGREK